MSWTPREIGTLIVVILKAVRTLCLTTRRACSAKDASRGIYRTSGTSESKTPTVLLSTMGRSVGRRLSSVVDSIQSGMRKSASHYMRTSRTSSLATQPAGTRRHHHPRTAASSRSRVARTCGSVASPTTLASRTSLAKRTLISRRC